MSVAVQVLAVGCGMMAGLYFAFSAFVMRSLGAIADPAGIAAMQSINRIIVRSAFLPLFALTSLASLGVAVWGVTRWGQSGSALLLAGGLTYLVGHFVFTAAFNVPLNDALDAVDATSPEGARLWSHYLRRWTTWNHVRTVACLASCVLLLAATR